MISKGFLPLHWMAAERIHPHLNFDLPATSKYQNNPAARNLWMHCASLGEAKGLWGLCNSLFLHSENHPQFVFENIWITTSTKSGLDFLIHQKGKSDAEKELKSKIHFSIAPLDHLHTVRVFISDRKITMLCLFEMELWPHYIQACNEKKIPIFFLSARISKKAFYWFQKFPNTVPKLFSKINWIQVQNPIDQNRLQILLYQPKKNHLETPPVSVGFDYKAAYFLKNLPEVSQIEASKPTQFDVSFSRMFPPSCIAFVSLHRAELIKLLAVIDIVMTRFSITIIPRHLSDLEFFQSKLHGKNFLLASQNLEHPFLLVDTMGQVSHFLVQCHSVFVGGSLIRIGCHNLWEPLVAGCKIYFGPYYQNQEALAERLIECSIAEVVRDLERLKDWQRPLPIINSTCGTILNSELANLDLALDECKRRLFATFESIPFK